MEELIRAIYRLYQDEIILGNLFAAVKKELPLVTLDEFAAAVVRMCESDPMVTWNHVSIHPLKINKSAFVVNAGSRIVLPKDFNEGFGGHGIRPRADEGGYDGLFRG